MLIPLNRKTVNNVVDSLKVETTSITYPQVQKVFTRLFNLIEVLACENEKLTFEKQQLKNEINELFSEKEMKKIKSSFALGKVAAGGHLQQ